MSSYLNMDFGYFSTTAVYETDVSVQENADKALLKFTWVCILCIVDFIRLTSVPTHFISSILDTQTWNNIASPYHVSTDNPVTGKYTDVKLSKCCRALTNILSILNSWFCNNRKCHHGIIEIRGLERLACSNPNVVTAQFDVTRLIIVNFARR